MTLHQLVPLVAFALNLTLLALVLARDHKSRTNQIFALMLAALGAWNYGAFMLRGAADAPEALWWERALHVGVILVPALYYHFILRFLGRRGRSAPELSVAYVLAGAFLVVEPTDWFMHGVRLTHWGYAPVGGPAYLPFFLYFQIVMLIGLTRLAMAYKRMESSFRRNRAKLVLIGTITSLLGGYIDFVRFIVPALDRSYPLGIPLNALFAVCLGIAVVRYRLIDVGNVAKRIAIYGGVTAAAFPLVVAVAVWFESRWEMRYSLTLREDLVLAFLIALLITPLTRWLEQAMDRLMFRKRYGFRQTLSDLRGRMGSFLDVSRLADTLVETLVSRIPLTHGVLYLHSPETAEYRVQRVTTSGATEHDWRPLPLDHPLVRWFGEHERILVAEEIHIRRVVAEALGEVEAELAAMEFALLIPLKSEGELLGILALGEKLSGDVFDAEELELLGVLGGQATIALQTSRLYEALKRSNEQLLAADRQRSKFFAQFSHELRTPLNSIIGFSKMLLKSRDGKAGADDDVEDLAAIHQNGVHLLNLINDVLDFAKMESGAVDVRIETVDIGELVDESVRLTQPLHRGRRLIVSQRVEPGLPPVTADRTKVRQVLLNLLSNAVKFTPEGSVTVTVENRGDEVLVTVSDTGIGIRPEDQPRLFQPFQQLNGERMHLPLGGTGLGLAISKSFVELHGGRIWVESEVDRGSRFYFTLPLSPVAVATIGPPDE